jgi:Zn-dependent M28 family amino/carboxypeptidase
MNKLSELGLNTSLQSFTQAIRNKSYNFSNIISYNNSLSKKHILLGAHIDSPNIEGSESAIDSASSIGIILELARCILQIDKDYPLLIVFFDGEEAINGPWSSDNTLIGSTYFANNYDLSKIEFVYILDLIGGSIENNKIFHYNENKDSFSIIKKMYEINQKYSKNIFVNPEIESSNKIMQDDHIPFKNKDVKYINFIPPIYPTIHHTINDTFNNLNWEYIELFSNIFFEFLIINKLN